MANFIELRAEYTGSNNFDISTNFTISIHNEQNTMLHQYDVSRDIPCVLSGAHRLPDHLHISVESHLTVKVTIDNWDVKTQ